MELRDKVSHCYSLNQVMLVHCLDKSKVIVTLKALLLVYLIA